LRAAYQIYRSSVEGDIILTDPKQEYEKILWDVSNNFIDSTDLSLEEWLKLIYDPPRDKQFDSYTFPTETHRNEYLATINKRSLAEIKKLIYFFLPPDGPLGQDIRSLADNELTHILERHISHYDDLPYIRKRWLLWALSKDERISPRESIYWVLDLVDNCPEEAIRVINAYSLLIRPSRRQNRWLV
jgi:restriction system protein